MEKKNTDTIYSPHTPSNAEKKDENSTNSKEVEYDWGQHPNSVKALKKHQYKKGQSGNVLGKKPTFDVLGKQLKSMANDMTYNWGKEELGSRKQRVLERIWEDAMRGDMKKIQLLAWLGCLD